MDVMNVTTTQFENLYACYSWPNVVLPIIGGKLVKTDWLKSNSRYSKINLSFSCFSLIIYFLFPNTFVGYLIDKVFGMRLGAVIFATFICLGK